MNKLLLAGILLVAMQSARADVTCPQCDDWKTRSKEAIEAEAYNASLDERFKQLPIMSNMPNWLTKPYPVKRRRQFR